MRYPIAGETGEGETRSGCLARAVIDAMRKP
jgi:hypothetical protein